MSIGDAVIQVFYLDVTYVVIAIYILMLQAYVSSISGVSDVCFKCFIWMLQKYIWILHNMHVASVCFKCFRYFICML
jgi:hypothetical protein